MWCYACSWDVRGDITLNSMAQIHITLTLLTSCDLTFSSGRLTCQHTPHISVVTHISWDVTYVSSALLTLSVVCRNGGNAYWKKFANGPVFMTRTVYVGGYTETDTTGMLSPRTAWRQKLTWDNVTWWYACVPPHMTWAQVTWDHMTWAQVTWAHMTWAHMTWAHMTWAHMTWAHMTSSRDVRIMCPRPNSVSCHSPCYGVTVGGNVTTVYPP